MQGKPNEDSSQAARVDSNAEASTSNAKAKTGSSKAQREQREQNMQKWLQSRAPRKSPERPEQPSEPKAPSRTSLKHRLLNNHNYPVTCIVFSPNCELLATASRDVRIYDTQTGALRVILDGHGGLVRSIAFTPDGRLLCSGSDDCAALVWSLEHCFAMCTPGTIVTLTPPGCPSSTNLPTNDPTQSQTSSSGSVTTGRPASAGVSISGGAGGSGSSQYSPLSRVVQRVLKRHHKPVLSVATTPDSKYLVTGSADKTVRVWDVCTGYIMATLRGHQGEVSTVAVTPNGRRIISSGTDRHIFVWDFVTGECKRALKGHKAAVSCMAVAPDGHYLVTGAHDKTVRVWDLVTGNELANLPAHSGAFGVLCCAVSSDGSTILSGGYDHLAKLWDAGSGLAVTTIEGHRHMVSSVAFSSDCTMLATAGRDDEVRIWNWVHTRVDPDSDSPAGATAKALSNADVARQDKIRRSQLEDAMNNRHWAYLFGGSSTPAPGAAGGDARSDREEEQHPLAAAGLGLRPLTGVSRPASVRDI